MGSSGQTRPPEPSADYRSHLLEMLHSRAGASATCLFLKHGDDFFRMEASCSEGDELIPRFLLPTSHRLVRTFAGMGEPVSIGMDSVSQRRELQAYRKNPLPEGSEAWLTLCPLAKGSSPDGFLLQDFTGGRPGSQVSKDLKIASRIMRESSRNGPARAGDGDDVPWIARLVAAVAQETLDASVQGLAGILSEALPGATISVADVDRETGRAGVWVSRGPLAVWRRDQTCTGGGIAGWVVKNRAPCRRCRMNKGSKSLYAFSDTDDIPEVVGSCIGVPVMVEGNLEAIIVAEHKEDDAFDRSHESLLLAGAGMMAMAAELADLRGRCSDSTDRDSLTGLPRITRMDRYLRKMASMVESYGWPVGVMVADIDGFSRINRELGYAAGDQVLLEASNRFTGVFGQEIFVARVGSDSFAACIPKADRAELEAFIQRLSNAMSWEFSGNSTDQRLGITVSVGACYTKTNRKVPLLTSEAEQAAGEAAGIGPGSHVLWRLGLFGREED